jgi:hypothetical protein
MSPPAAPHAVPPILIDSQNFFEIILSYKATTSSKHIKKNIIQSIRKRIGTKRTIHYRRHGETLNKPYKITTTYHERQRKNDPVKPWEKFLQNAIIRRYKKGLRLSYHSKSKASKSFYTGMSTDQLLT